MRLEQYLNESYEDKIFTLIDKFMQDKKIKSTTGLVSNKNFESLIAVIGNAFNIDRISINMSDTLSAYARTIGRNIEMFVPLVNIDKNLKLTMLSILFHEIAHLPVQGEILKAYITPRKPLTDFSNYYVQGIERPAMAISASLTAIINKVDLLDDLKTIEDLAAKATSLDGLNVITRKTIMGKYNLSSSDYDTLYSLFVVCLFIHSLHLQNLDDPESKRLANMFKMKWDKLEKNVTNSYRKFHAYFTRYKLW